MLSFIYFWTYLISIISIAVFIILRRIRWGVVTLLISSTYPHTFFIDQFILYFFISSTIHKKNILKFSLCSLWSVFWNNLPFFFIYTNQPQIFPNDSILRKHSKNVNNIWIIKETKNEQKMWSGNIKLFFRFFSPSMKEKLFFSKRKENPKHLLLLSIISFLDTNKLEIAFLSSIFYLCVRVCVGYFWCQGLNLLKRKIYLVICLNLNSRQDNFWTFSHHIIL